MGGGGGGESVLLHIWAVVQDNPTLVPRNIFHWCATNSANWADAKIYAAT